jgi:hypothetical protein
MRQNYCLTINEEIKKGGSAMKQLKSKKFLMSLAILALLVGLGGGQAVWAESNLVVGGSATAHLDFAITIPTILFLQVGTDAPGIIDRVSCTLADIPGTGAVPMTSSGANPVPVRVAALVPATAPVRLLANSSTPLTNGAASNIPFDQISWAAGGAFSAGTFNNGAAQVLDTFAGSGNRVGNYTFSYANANYYDAGAYTGQVTYTLSSP